MRTKKSVALETIASVQERAKARGATHIGDLVGWNVGKIDVPRAQARKVFTPLGLGDLVPNLKVETALTRAVGQMGKVEGFRVFPFKSPNPDTLLAYGVYAIHANGERGDEHKCHARVRIVRDQCVARPPEVGAAEKSAMVLAEELAQVANHILTHAQTQDVSSALTQAMKKGISASPLRRAGGLYLVPESKCQLWTDLMPELMKIGVDPLQIEMYDTPQNVETAKATAKSALEDDIAALKEDLGRALDQDMRHDTIARRIVHCQELQAKAELYRNVLRDAADDIQRRVENMARAFNDVLGSSSKEDNDLFTIQTDAA